MENSDESDQKRSKYMERDPIFINWKTHYCLFKYFPILSVEWIQYQSKSSKLFVTSIKTFQIAYEKTKYPYNQHNTEEHSLKTDTTWI